MKRSFFIPISGLWLLTSGFSHAILDSNNNGVSDFWERDFNNGSLFDENFDPQADYDSDGWTNAQEAAAGTNPFVPNPPDGMIRPAIGHIPAVYLYPEEEGEPESPPPDPEEEPDPFDPDPPPPGPSAAPPEMLSPGAITVTWPTLTGKQYTLFFSPDLTQGSWVPVDEPFIASGGEVTYSFVMDESDKLFWRVAVQDVDTDGDGLTNHEEFLAGTDPALVDTDGDTVSDLEEVIIGTDPNHADNDYDGMEDRWEIAHGLDPEDPYDAYDDPDGDGIENRYEYVLGFDPHNAATGGSPDNAKDRDGDGMPDFWEAADGDVDGWWWSEKWIWDQTLRKYVFVRGLDWEINDANEDPDNDGLENLAEFSSGTFPLLYDSDGDYLPDGWEVQYGLDPVNGWETHGDPDGDGIQNQYEYILGFHPTIANPAELTADRDNDGMPDLWEAQTGSFQWSSQNQRYEFQRKLDWENPADAAQDPDADGLTNLAEYQNGTAPFNWDSDGDYLPDGWEIQHGLVAAYRIHVNGTWVYGANGANGRTGDPDADGIQNQYEYVLGFHPTIANPAALTADRDNDGLPDLWEAQTGSFQWSSQNQRYEFQRKLDWENPADAAQDPDADGLTNLAEYQNGTAPFNWDTDGDYLPDGWEIQHGLVAAYSIQVNGTWIYGANGVNGRTGDPDADGIQNQYEYVLGFHPTIANSAELTADRDNDGMPDLWEAKTGSFQWSSQNQRYEFQRKLDWENPADAAQDPDADGLANLAEYQATTAIYDWDTDGDNLSDGWEVTYALNPKSTTGSNGATGDPDGDGIQNQYEQALGFHPTTANPAELTADRDGDGMPDAWEAATAAGRHTTPTPATGFTRLVRALDWELDDSGEDYDSDGLTNLQEYQAGLDPSDPDSDDDLLPDGWEVLHGFDPHTPSPDALTADPDGDGYSNFMEALMGTDPFDPASHPPTAPGNNISGTPNPSGNTNPSTPPTPPSPNSGTAKWRFEAVTSARTLPKRGYAEFSPTVPPKRYLKLLETVAFGLHGECDPPESRIDGTRLTTVDPLDGTRQVDDRQYPGNNNMGGATTAQSPVVAAGISQVTSYDDEPNSKSDCNATKTYTLKLSQENTTAQLIANTRAQLPAYQSTYASWRTPHAYRNLDKDELGLNYQKCKYRITWQSGTPAENRHQVTWLLVFQPETPEGQAEAPAPEVIRSHQWDGASETSPEYELDPEIEKPGKDGSYYLLPVEVVVRRKGDVVPTNGVLVKTHDVIEFALAPSFFDSEDNFESLITWEFRQRKADGTYEDWVDAGGQCTGTKFECAFVLPGIFQVKAVIANVGYEYKRKKDEKIGNFEYGPGKKDQPDCIGICSGQIELDICREAQNFYGSEEYAASNVLVAQYGFPEYPASGNSIIRCNIFVAHRATAAGAVVPKINGYFNEYPPLANEWAGIEDTSIWPGDPTYIAGWRILPSGTHPEPGCIIAHPQPGDAGHCAITDYDGEGIGAGISGTVNKNYDEFWDGTSRFRKYQP